MLDRISLSVELDQLTLRLLLMKLVVNLELYQLQEFQLLPTLINLTSLPLFSIKETIKCLTPASQWLSKLLHGMTQISSQ